MHAGKTSPFKPKQLDLLILRDAITRSAEALNVLTRDSSVDGSTAFTEAVREGWTRRLMESARVSKDQSAVEVVRRWVEMGAEYVAQVPGAIVDGHGPDEVRPWAGNLSSRARMVCLIEVPYTTIRGSGFLIGPDLVVTAFHVMEALISDESYVPKLELTFGRERDERRSTELPGTRYCLGRDWLVASCESLDYAVLRVNGVPGDDTGGERRGWIYLHANADVDRDFFVGLIHHPEDASLHFPRDGFAIEHRT